MGDGRTDDPLGILIPKQKTSVNDDPLGIKKKVTTQEQFGIPLPVFKGGGAVGVSNGQSDGMKITGKAEQKPQQAEEPYDIKDPVKSELAPFRKKATEDFQKLKSFGEFNPYAGAESVKQKGMFALPVNARKDEKYQAQVTQQQSADHLNHATEVAYNSFFKNGKVAKEFLQKQYQENNGQLDENNETLQLAASKANRFETLKEKAKNKNINELAVDLARESSPYMDKLITELEKGQGIEGYGDYYKNVVPQAMQGRLVEDLANDPDMRVVAEEDPKIKSQLEDFDKNKYELYPDLGKVKVRNILSQEYERRRSNLVANPIFNKSDYLDKLSDEVFKDNSQLKAVADKMKGNWQGELNTSGLVDEFASGASSTVKGMGESVKDAIGLGDTHAERIYKGLEQEYSHVDSGVKGWKKDFGTAANFGGMITAMAAGGVPLKGLGLSPAAINATITADTFYDNELNKYSLMYPGEQWKARAGALLSTAAYASVAKAFPSTKFADAVSGKLAPEIESIVKNLNEGAIGKELVKTTAQKFVDVLKKTIGGTGEATGHMVAVTTFQKVLDDTFGIDPEANKKYHPDSEILDVARNMVIGSAFPQAAIAIGNRNAIGKSLLANAEFPERSLAALDVMKAKGIIDDSEYNKKVEDIQYLNKLNQELKDNGVTPKNKGRFLMEAMNEKYKKESIVNNPESSVTRRTQNEIRGSQEVQDKILNGEDVVGNEEKSHVPKEESSVAIIQPEENKVADIIPLKKINENTEEPIKPDEPVPAEAQEPATTTILEDKQSAETGQGEPPKEPAANDLPFGKQETIGVAHEAQQVRAYDVNANQPVRGEGVSTAESIEHGKKLISDGKDPEKIAEAFKADPDKNISYDAISVARAHYNSLAKETNAAADKFGETSDQYKEAKERERKWYDETYKPMQTEWSKIGESQQGLTDIDTGSYAGIIRAKEAATGKGATREQAKEARNLRKHIEKIETEHEKLKEQFTTAINEYATSAKENKSYSAKAQSLANKIREKAKLHRPGSFSAATPASLVWDGAVEVVAKSVEAGGILADAIAAGLKHIQESAWYKGLTDDKKKEAEEDFEKWHEEEKELSPEEKNIQRLKDELERLKKEGTLKDKSDKRKLTDEEKKITAEIEKEKERIRYNNLAEDLAWKRDNKFTPDQSKEIWSYVKRMYIDNNPNFQVADMVNKVAMDLGLTPEQVRHALAPNPIMKKLTDQMYRNQYERNKAGRTVEQWVNKSKESVVDKMFNAVASPFRSLATLGHGHALLFTHAAANIYDPALVKKFFELAGKQFKIVYGNSTNYEKASERLKNDKLYNTALKAGVGVDPNTIYDDWQIANTWLKKLGVQGNKGFLVLKIMRMEVFKYHYNKLSDIEKADKETVKTVGTIANHWTGTAGLKVSPAANAFIFAPNLIVSKFARLTTDPAKALITYGKLGLGKDVSTADRAAARIILHKSGRVMAMYLASLVANQALLSITGSNQSINFTNPFKSDWLKYKAGNKTIDASGGMLSTMQFLSQLGALPFQGKKGLKENYYGAGSPRDALASTLSGQARKMASPFGSIAFDALTHTDYSGNVVPWANDKPRAGREKLSVLDYAMQKMPIPVADAYKEVGEQMKEDGVSTPTVKNILGGLLAVGITSSGIKEGNEPKERPSPFTKEDEKDPTFKFFLDKGLELPNTSPASEEITEKENGTKKMLSDYPKEKQQEYETLHKSLLKEELQNILDRDNVFVTKYKDASGKDKNEVSVSSPSSQNYDEKGVKSLTKDELAQLLHIAQSKATTRTKKELFNQ